MAEFNPRNRNEKTREAKKATAHWFDDYAADKRERRALCGFHIPEGDRR